MLGRVPGHVTFVPVEFGRDDVACALRDAGFAFDVPTLVLWEGVTNYLTADIVDQTFRFVAATIRSGSPVLFTYIDRRVLDGAEQFEGALESSRHVGKVGEPYTFGFDPREVPAYLADRGFELESDVTVAQAASRYYAEGQRPPASTYYHVVEARRS
jgi:methyltransferase (TIGR00027 family)